jgi:hypothetical protein
MSFVRIGGDAERPRASHVERNSLFVLGVNAEPLQELTACELGDRRFGVEDSISHD